MATYTTSANVQVELPASLPTDFVTNYMAGLISSASGQVESLVGPSYVFAYESNAQKFPDIGSTPATPDMIEYCARLLAASMGYARLKEINKLSGKDLETKLRNKAERYLADIREGNFVISLGGVNLRSNRVDHKTDVHLYPDDGDITDPIFNDSNFEGFI